MEVEAPQLISGININDEEGDEIMKKFKNKNIGDSKAAHQSIMLDKFEE